MHKEGLIKQRSGNPGPPLFFRFNKLPQETSGSYFSPLLTTKKNMTKHIELSHLPLETLNTPMTYIGKACATDLTITYFPLTDK